MYKYPSKAKAKTQGGGVLYDARHSGLRAGSRAARTGKKWLQFDLGDAGGVAPSLEFGGEKGVEDRAGFSLADKARRE